MKNSICVCLQVALFGDVTKDDFNPNAIVTQRAETSPQCRNAFLLSPSVSEFRFPVQG